MAENHSLKRIIYTPRLPNEYIELEYIQSSGTQYIDTGFTPNQDTKVDITFQAVDSSSYGRGFYGSRVSSGYRAFTTWFSSSNGFRDNYGSQNTNGLAVKDTNKHHLVKDKNLVYYDETLIHTNTYETFTCPGNMFLFAINEGATPAPAWLGSYKIFDYKMYNNGISIRNLIPAKRTSDSEIGMYDTVSNTFFTNAGTGTFTAGPEASSEYTIYKSVIPGSVIDNNIYKQEIYT